jgi:hypothetical protein
LDLIYGALDVFSGKKNPVKDESPEIPARRIEILEIDGVPVPLKGTKKMNKYDLKEAEEVFVYIMDEMDYQGDPDDVEAYKNIREIFETGARPIAGSHKEAI